MQTVKENGIESVILDEKEKKEFAVKWSKSRDFYGGAATFITEGLGIDKGPDTARGYYLHVLEKLEKSKKEFVFPLAYFKSVEDIVKKYENGDRGPGIIILDVKIRGKT